MELTERVVLTDAFAWHDETGERLFAAGAHTLPIALAQAARDKGLVAQDEPDEPAVEPAPAAEPAVEVAPESSPATAAAGE